MFGHQATLPEPSPMPEPFTAPLKLLLSAHALATWGKRIEAAVPAGLLTFVTAEAAGAGEAPSEANIAFMTREVTGASSKGNPTAELRNFGKCLRNSPSLRWLQIHPAGAELPIYRELRGRGVKVAILDSGFRGYRAFLGRALPQHVSVRSFRKDGNLEARDSQHGIWCGAVMHTLAPEAELLLANWEGDSPESFLAAARWARSCGVWFSRNLRFTSTPLTGSLTPSSSEYRKVGAPFSHPKVR